MSDDWQCVLNETSVHFLLALRLRQRQQLLAAFDALTNDPLQKGGFETKDQTGRPIQGKGSRAILDFVLARFLREGTENYKY